MPGGVIESGDKNLTVDPSGEFKNEHEIGDVLVATTNGRSLYLRDVATVARGYESPARFLNFYGARGDDGTWRRSRAVTLAVQMRAGQKIGDFATLVDAKLEELSAQLPNDLVLARTSDQPRQVEENIHLFMGSLYEAVALVVLVSLIGFWEWRSALLMALSIPITLAMTFGMMAMFGIDLQQVSIASLIIALGLLVDDPVVAGDAIKRDLAAGHPRLVAAWWGPDQAGEGHPLRHDHQHRRLPAVPGPARRSRPVRLQPAGGHRVLAGRLADRLDDLHPAARLLPAAAEGGAVDRRAAQERIRGGLLPRRQRRDPAPLGVPGRIARRARARWRVHAPAEDAVLSGRPPVPVVRRRVAAGGRARWRPPIAWLARSRRPFAASPTNTPRRTPTITSIRARCSSR